jgi:archaeal flagellar protein FlaJ
MDKKTNSNSMLLMTVTTVSLGIAMIVLSLLVFSSINLMLISIFIMPIGPFLYFYTKYQENKEVEKRFPDFLKDVAQNIRTGMTIPQSIVATKENYYGSLTPFVKKMTVQLDWGVPLDKILIDFANSTTKSLKRTVSTIIDTHRGGGDIAEIFDSVGKSTEEMNRINEERSSAVYNQMLTGYVIFFVFIGVLVMMQLYLLPSMELFSYTDSGVASAEQSSSFFSDTFRTLIIIQGFFSGLVIGKMSEGSLISGLKHSIILVMIGSLVLLLI